MPTVLLGILSIILLPDRPETTKFFNDDERLLALERANRYASSDVGYSLSRSKHAPHISVSGGS